MRFGVIVVVVVVVCNAQRPYVTSRCTMFGWVCISTSGAHMLNAREIFIARKMQCIGLAICNALWNWIVWCPSTNGMDVMRSHPVEWTQNHLNYVFCSQNDENIESMYLVAVDNCDIYTELNATRLPTIFNGISTVSLLSIARAHSLRHNLLFYFFFQTRPFQRVIHRLTSGSKTPHVMRKKKKIKKKNNSRFTCSMNF